MPERPEVLPVGVQLDHPGDDALDSGLIGNDARPFLRVLLGLPNDLRVLVVVDLLVTAKTMPGARAATMSGFAIHYARSGSPASAPLYLDWAQTLPCEGNPQ
jgi:hypothetical protein